MDLVLFYNVVKRESLRLSLTYPNFTRAPSLLDFCLLYTSDAADDGVMV